MSAPVTGFGCRPNTGVTTRATGPAFESRQGREARGMGHLDQRVLWGFGWHLWCSKDPSTQTPAQNVGAIRLIHPLACIDSGSTAS